MRVVEQIKKKIKSFKKKNNLEGYLHRQMRIGETKTK